MLPLFEALRSELRPRYSEWCKTPGAPKEIIEALDAINRANEPWLDIIAIYLMRRETIYTHSSLSAQIGRINAFRHLWKKLWISQGFPAVSDVVLPKKLPEGIKNLHTTIGLALDNMIYREPKLRDLTPIARTLCPGHYLKSIGWKNLPIPSDMMRLLLRRSGSPSELEVPEEYVELLKCLTSYRAARHFLPLISAAICLLGERVGNSERNTPRSIRSAITKLNCILKQIFDSRDIVSLSEMKPSYITFYINNSQDYEKHHGRASYGSRIDYLTAYLACYDAQQRYKYEYPNDNTLSNYYLPPVPKNLNISQLIQKSISIRRENRRRDVKQLMPHYQRLLQITVMRALVIQSLRKFGKHALEHSKETFDLPLPDLSATIKLRWTTPKEVDAEIRGDRATVGDTTKCLQYLGAYDSEGIMLPNEPFFVKSLIACSLNQHVGPRDLPQDDLMMPGSGLFFPSGKLRTSIRETVNSAKEHGCPLPILFELDSLAGGIAIGVLLLMICSTTGMRMHEVQQIRINDGKTVILKIKPKRQNHQKTKPYRVFRVYYFPKGAKRERKQEKYKDISIAIKPYWNHLVNDLDDARGKFQKVITQGSAEWQLQPGVYLFQWHGKALKHYTLNALLRLTTLGALPEGAPSAHLLRHAMAHSAKSLGATVEQIQRQLGHKQSNMTKYYAGSDNIPLTSATMMTIWEALTYDAAAT
ncbi:site-specific integrase [Deinococcus fonticola]|uniref:site-specific integrase n=1 Tax=Deinococcus fonticola TaxID=2528713 RepID=UPI00107506EB|nr:site-specific integrase [Deinococcus fonticola]